MRRFDSRLRKLEAAQPGRGECGPVAVIEHPFPCGDETEWAWSILGGFDAPAATWILEGAVRKVLLPPTYPAEIEQGSEAERVWLDASASYPHYLIVSDGAAGLQVERFNSEAHYKTRIRELAGTADG